MKNTNIDIFYSTLSGCVFLKQVLQIQSDTKHGTYLWESCTLNPSHRLAFAAWQYGVLLVRHCTACHRKALGTIGCFSGRTSVETGFVQQIKQLAISWPARSFHRSGTQEITLYSDVKFIF